MIYLSAVPLTHAVYEDARWHDARWQHRATMRLFGDVEADNARADVGVLFRVEPRTGGGRVLVQSETPPEVDGIRTIDLAPLLDALRSGRPVAFTLAANTVRTINRTREDGQTRRHRARIPESQLDGWLKDRLNGAIDITSLAAPEPQKLRQGPAQLLVTTFHGQGHVADPDHLRDLIRRGVGRAKAYGCGLLSVAVP